MVWDSLTSQSPTQLDSESLLVVSLHAAKPIKASLYPLALMSSHRNSASHLAWSSNGTVTAAWTRSSLIIVLKDWNATMAELLHQSPWSKSFWGSFCRGTFGFRRETCRFCFWWIQQVVFFLMLLSSFHPLLLLLVEVKTCLIGQFYGTLLVSEEAVKHRQCQLWNWVVSVSKLGPSCRDWTHATSCKKIKTQRKTTCLIQHSGFKPM